MVKNNWFACIIANSPGQFDFHSSQNLEYLKSCSVRAGLNSLCTKSKQCHNIQQRVVATGLLPLHTTVQERSHKLALSHSVLTVAHNNDICHFLRLWSQIWERQMCIHNTTWLEPRQLPDCCLLYFYDVWICSLFSVYQAVKAFRGSVMHVHLSHLWRHH